MSEFEVAEPILNSPFAEPGHYWYIREGETPEKREGRRPAFVFPPRDQTVGWTHDGYVLKPSQLYPTGFELALVNLIRDRRDAWESAGYPGVSRTTYDLLQWWQRDGREKPLFYAQLEAAKTIIFLREARQDFLQGIRIPSDEPSEDRKADGFTGFERYAAKMATGAGKTTVMGMVIAWSVLNKVNSRGDARFSDVALVVCPNVTIRSRLEELKPEGGDASVYRTRDLVPVHLMPQLMQGKVLVTNWHVFEPQAMQTGGVSAKVEKRGKAVDVRAKILIGRKTTTARGKRYVTLASFTAATADGAMRVIPGTEKYGPSGGLVEVEIVEQKYIESDTALLQRVLGRDVGGKQNILILNDEAHHAYRIRKDEPDPDEEEEESDEFFKEATVWVDGLDKVHKHRGINLCVDLSATPYFLGRVGQETNKPFPWVVSDFGLVDAIESGLVKIPQLAVRDTTGAEIPGYRNIWQWVMEPGRLTSAERGGSKASPKPEAVLKWAHTPISMLAGLWQTTLDDWAKDGQERPPVFILVCKNTKLSQVIYAWLAKGEQPSEIPPARIVGLRNTEEAEYTIRVDSKVVSESDSEGAKSDDVRWMRFTLDTVGKLDWPRDSQGRPIYPENFEELARKSKRGLHPPGRDVRCIVSVGMLTEGWDCNTVTHIIGLRPFMSQLLCEQVVGRGLRRSSYALADGKFPEEVATVFGVPFEVIPYKANPAGGAQPKEKRHHVHALPDRQHLEIRFPRVEGYTQAIRNRIDFDWQNVPPLVVDPQHIPPEVEMKGLSVDVGGKMSLSAPGKTWQADLNARRNRHRMQELVFDTASHLTRLYAGQPGCAVPRQTLFPQLLRIVERFVSQYITAVPPAEVKDALLCSPYYGWLVETLKEHVRPDTSQGEAPEVPIYETGRDDGSTADVDTWTSKEVRPVLHSHVNYVVADTHQWEQAAAYLIDTHPRVRTFVKNAGLGLGIPYLNNGQMHEYVPDFLIQFHDLPGVTLILETKGFDPLADKKKSAAERWVAAVNAEGKLNPEKGHGQWRYAMVRKVGDVPGVLASMNQG